MQKETKLSNLKDNITEKIEEIQTLLEENMVENQHYNDTFQSSRALEHQINGIELSDLK